MPFRKLRVAPQSGTCVGNSASSNKPSTPGKDVRASGRERTPSAAPNGRGERTDQKAGDISLPRQAYALGSPEKKVTCPHAAENWLVGFKIPSASVACRPVGWRNSAAPHRIVAVGS